MPNQMTPDLECKALYWKGPNKEYVLVEYLDGSAGLYYQGQKIAGFASKSAGYKSWLRAARRWQKAKTPTIADVIRLKEAETKDPVEFLEWLSENPTIADMIRLKEPKDPVKFAEWLSGYDLKAEDYPDPEAVARLRRKLYEIAQGFAYIPDQD
jgi:hypothetical protein